MATTKKQNKNVEKNNSTTAKNGTLKQSVEGAMELFFHHLDGQPVSNLYEMVMEEVEIPLLNAVMKQAGFNQCKASEMLGLNRGTLRKKLKHHNLI